MKSSYARLLLLIYLSFFLEKLGKTQILHNNSCSAISTNFTLDWDSSPNGNQFNWTPQGSTTFTAPNVQGSGYQIAFSLAGSTGTLAVENGINTPGITNSLSGGTDALHISSSGLNQTDELELTMTFTPALAGDISFDIYNIIELVGGGTGAGQQVEVFGLTSGGFAIVPELTDNGTPSYELEGPGVVDGNASSTAGTNDQLGVNFKSVHDISTIHVILRRCSDCGNAANTEIAIGDIDICLVPDTDQDGIADTQDDDDDNDGIYDEIEKCPASTPVTAEWDNMTYNNGDASNTYALPDGTDMTVAVASNGASIIFGGTSTNQNGGNGAGTVGLELFGNQNIQVNSIDVSFSWNQAIDDLSFTIFDVDLSNTPQFVDSITIIGYYNGFVVFPTLTGSSENTVTQNRVVGSGVHVVNDSGDANVTVNFAEPIDSMMIFYGNSRNAPLTPGNQAVTIWDLTYIGDCGSVDTDGDGVDDYLDIDADNDGIVDYIEWQSSTGTPIAPAGTDADSDGIDDNFETVGSPEDTDGDGIPDFKDPDSDDDGDLDIIEGWDTDNDGIADTTPSGTDADGDGLDDAFDNVNGLNSTTNVTNSGETSDDFPNLDETLTTERDWREDGDFDEDGIQNYADIDDDNDGILDVDEGKESNNPTADEDGDGIPNWADNTDDGNGGDGSASDYTDSNGDGIPDVYDADNDGTPNHLDLDSDGDGIGDLVEAGGVDTDGNGVVDGVFTDTDGDGWSNTFDSDNGGTALADIDVDSDGLQSHLDIDSDDDGIIDIIESQPSGALINPSVTDTDNDGIDDNFDADNGNTLTDPENTDGGDNPDYLDTDSDNDGDADSTEGWDTDNDGVADTTPAGTDTDNDGLDDNFDNVNGQNSTVNITNGGQTSASFPNLDEPLSAELDWRESEDTDGDGIIDAYDLDKDDDGILDRIECGAEEHILNGGSGGSTINFSSASTVNFAYVDLNEVDNSFSLTVNGAGLHVDNMLQFENITRTGELRMVFESDNAVISSPWFTNNNGLPRIRVFISNSGSVEIYGSRTTTSTSMELMVPVSGATFNDINWVVGANTFTWVNPNDGGGDELKGTAYLFGDCDQDGDGIANYLDLDSDNDGVTDIIEAGGVDTDEDGRVDNNADTNSDGYANTFDPVNGGTELAINDTDDDGIDDYLDLDSDGDGIGDIVEAGGTDTDGNGVVDGAFTDVDGDGWSNTFDNDNGGTALVDNDEDNDGLQNRIDIDSDDDGIVDIIESQPTGTLINPSGVDADGDGIDDNFDTDSGNALTAPENTDGTDNPDYLDTDSDNDGDLDILEAWDINNDGVADTTPSGTDTDNDGLDDNFDNVPGSNNTTNITNGGESSGSFPNQDIPTTTERDWRESGINDSDGDGVVDIIDIDKDNDGVLDRIECNAGTHTINSTSGNNTINFSDVGVHTMYMDLDIMDNSFSLTINGSGLNANNVLQFESTVHTGEIRMVFDSDGALMSQPWSTNSNGVPRVRLYIDEDGGVAVYGTRTTSSTNLELMAPEDGSTFNTVNWVSGTNTFVFFHPEDVGGETITGEAYTLGDCDQDGDGVPNYIDLDADNDGIADIIEAGGVDTDNDGRADNGTDTNGDGYVNIFDPLNGGTELPIVDTDNDGIENYLDLDSDSDGLLDNVEGQTTIGFRQPLSQDTDGDGWDNQYDSDNGGTAITLSNNEGAGEPDYLDDDSDGDGFLDWLEGFDEDADGDALADLMLRAINYEASANNPLHYINTDDTDNDGIPNWLEDDDGDNVPNFLDPDNALYFDDDEDGIVNLYDPNNNGVSSLTPDLDGDGEYDFRDIDNQVSLPVDLLDFTANKVGEEVLLEWITLSEINSDYFTIERTTNGVDFKPILMHSGAGNSDRKRVYQMIDEKPMAGNNYYRLRQTDYDGKTETYNIEVVYFNINEFISISPNPSNGDKLVLELKGAEEGSYVIELLSQDSKLIKRKEFLLNNESRFALEILEGLSLTSGTYYLRVIGANHTQVKLFLVQ